MADSATITYDKWSLFNAGMYLGGGMFVGVVAVAAFVGALGLVVMPTDDSDFGRFDRSGLSIYTDAKTGIEYIGRGGCILPRYPETRP